MIFNDNSIKCTGYSVNKLKYSINFKGGSSRDFVKFKVSLLRYLITKMLVELD